MIISGKSLGGAVAIHTAAAMRGRPIAGLIVENAWTSYLDMIDDHSGWFKGKLNWLK